MSTSGANFITINEYFNITKLKNKKIFFILDPWSLRLNKKELMIFYLNEKTEFKYHELISNITKILDFIIESSNINLKILVERLVNFKNIDYSPLVLYKNSNAYYDSQVYFYDGSLAYGREYIKNSAVHNPAYISNVLYKFSEYQFNHEEMNVFNKIFNTLKAGNKVYVILLPMNKKNEESDWWNKLLQIEKIQIDWLKSMNITVLGSYTNTTLCSGNEYYDDIHLTGTCLNKVFYNIIRN